MSVTIFGLRPDSRTEVIIDGAHLHSLCRNLAFDIDFEALRAALFKDYNCRRITYLIRVLYNDSGDIAQEALAKLLDFLRYNGYMTVVGEAKEWNDGGRRSVRNSVDVPVTVAMMNAAKRVEDIILIAGSEDLIPAVDSCMADGVRVTLVSSRKTAPHHMLSGELRSVVDSFIDLADVKDKIIRREREPFPPRESILTEMAAATVLEDRRRAMLGR